MSLVFCTTADDRLLNCVANPFAVLIAIFAVEIAIVLINSNLVKILENVDVYVEFCCP